ncbi:hypothetical protein LDENG_00275360 [Lucifuga dentata]|nr:hypothetical protein LDENG_00275360 [Lucifuga dentata]
MSFGDQGELRMLTLNQNKQSDSISSKYENMQPPQASPTPSPKPSPRAHNSTVGSGAEIENKPAHLTTADEMKQPSPVPKPRKKMPIN